MLLALDGLHPPSMGARVSIVDAKAAGDRRPFAEAKVAVGGYAAADLQEMQSKSGQPTGS